MAKIMKILLWAIPLTLLMVSEEAFSPIAAGQSLFIRGSLSLISIFFTLNLFSDKNFRDRVSGKIRLLVKQPLFISISAFIFINITSTIFAVNKYDAFWGTTERQEGLIGILFFFLFFVFSLIIFEKKDWFLFFKLNLIVSFIILIKEFIQFFNGIGRPSSFLDNPTFLAGYLLFSIFCGIIVLSQNKFWKYFSIVSIILSILGIFITETRGTLIAIFVGFIAVLIYFIIKGKSTSYWKLNLRTTSIIILSLTILFSAVFFTTRKSEVWQKVPGLSRVAVISGSDATTQTRLLMVELSLQSVNPKEEGLNKLLIGWGPENFSLAYGKYFNPKQFDYEDRWFDRSHNKLLDLLVMTGIIGLLAYLSIYFFFFKSILKKKDFSVINTGLLFFGISLFIHLLFVFDQITTSIPFFASVSFLLGLRILDTNNKDTDKYLRNYKSSKPEKISIGVLFLGAAIFSSFIFFRNDILGYMQMKEYKVFKKNIDTKIISGNTDSVFQPFTPSQKKIREDFLIFTIEKIKVSDLSHTIITNEAILRGEEYVERNPLDVRFLISLATAYTNKGIDLHNSEFLVKGEMYFKRFLSFSPNRSDGTYDLAANLFNQKKYEESLKYFEKSFNLSSKYFLNEFKNVEGIYTFFLKHFYDIKDKENFIITAKRLQNSNYLTKDNLDMILYYFDKLKGWPPINFS